MFTLEKRRSCIVQSSTLELWHSITYLSLIYVLSFSIIHCTKFLYGRNKMAQSCHIPRKKKLKSPYVDHRFLNVATTIWSCMGFQKKNLLFSLTSSQIWQSPLVEDHLSTHLTKLQEKILLLLCVPLSYLLHLRDEWEGQTLKVKILT
jgi:hypothetical protein